MKSGVLAEPVLVGREQELQELEAYLNSAFEGKGKTVFILGEAGSGKTRLTHEFLKKTKDKRVSVMAGWCLSDSTAPYFPFVEAFNTYFASFEDESLSLHQPEAHLSLTGSPQTIGSEVGVTSWLISSGPIGKLGKPMLSPQVWKDQVFANVAKILHSVSNQVAIILLLEDIHWADSASLALLHYLARASSSEKILILATIRSEELTTDAEGHPHPLAETMRMMRREDLFTEIKLSSLDKGSISKIAKNMVGVSLQPLLVEKLASESRGNPLFIVESLRMLHERKSLIQENNECRLAIDTLGIPPKIKDIILRRLSVLKYTQRRILDAASVIGEKFDIDLLSNVLGTDSLEVLETLNMIANATSLVTIEENRYRFDHARSRETLYEELSPPLKRGYHQRIAEKLENVKGNALPLSDIAYHYAQAENKDKAIKYTLAAAKDELARFSNQQAIKHFQYILQNTTEEQTEEKKTALEGLGDAYTANSMYTEAIKTFDDLAASSRGSIRLRAFRKAMDAAFLKGDKPDVLLDYARKAEELADCDRLEMARIIDNRGRAFGWAGRGTASRDLADYDAALQIFEEENSLPDVADALWRSGAVCTLSKDLRTKGIGKILRSIALFRETGDTRKEVSATLVLAQGFLFSGLIPEYKNECLKVLNMGEKLGSFSELAQASSSLSMLFGTEGEFAEAISQDLKALTYWRKTDVEWLGAKIYGELACLYAKLGDLQKAEEYYGKILAMSPESLKQFTAAYAISRAKRILTTAKNQWIISEEMSDVTSSRADITMGYQIHVLESAERSDFAWVLRKQGKVEDAEAQIEAIQKDLKNARAGFEHTNLQATLMVQREVQVEQEFEMRFDIVNIAIKSGMLIRIECVIPIDFVPYSMPTFCSLQNGDIETKDKAIGSFQVETIKLQLKATRAGSYNLTPRVTFEDDLGKTRTHILNSIIIVVQPSQPAFEVLPNRVATGYSDLNRLLYGGIPEKYTVMLASPSNNERTLLIKKFLETGANMDETTFYITNDEANTRVLAEKYPSNFHVVLCNPQADAIFHDLPNVSKLRGIENLTEINIALTKSLRSLNTSASGTRRICIDIISDALLQHHAVNTRRWLSSLLPILKLKGFTILAVINPQMHTPEETQAILGLFEGEIRISERETSKGTEKTLKIRKLINQKYLENELLLDRQKLEQ